MTQLWVTQIDFWSIAVLMSKFYLVHIKDAFGMVNRIIIFTKMWSIQVGYCSHTRYWAYSIYEHTQDLPVYIHSWTVVKVTVPKYDPTHYYALWALCRNSITHEIATGSKIMILARPGISPWGHESILCLVRSLYHELLLRKPMDKPSILPTRIQKQERVQEWEQ